jgi:hypothetical protein
MSERGEDYDAYEKEEEAIRNAVSRVRSAASEIAPVLEVERSVLPGTPLLPDDTIVAIGQDGLVANTLRYSGEIPILGVNPDPSSYEGVLLPFDVVAAISALRGQLSTRYREITLAECRTGSGAVVRGANDLFIGKRDHTSARYKICHGGREERHSSSGIIVSTPLGATGWQRSVVAGALGILSAVTGTPAKKLEGSPVDSAEAKLRFWVREPWPSINSSASLVAGGIGRNRNLRVVSEMGEGGVVFADGMVEDCLPLPAGEALTIFPAAQKGRLLLPVR